MGRVDASTCQRIYCPFGELTASVSDRFGPSRIVSHRFGPFRIVFGPLRTVSDHFGPFSDRFGSLLDRFRSVSDLFGRGFYFWTEKSKKKETAKKNYRTLPGLPKKQT